MAVRLNHTIVAARDRDASARFLAEILGLPAPATVGPFAVVQVGDTSLDFIDDGDEIVSQHYAFLLRTDPERRAETALRRIVTTAGRRSYHIHWVRGLRPPLGNAPHVP